MLSRPYVAVLVVEVLALGMLLARGETHDAVPHGYLIGWLGTGSMLLMHVYSVRRRVRALSRLGKLRDFLHFHIFAGLQGALFVSYHSIRLHSSRNLQALNILLVGIVVCSGAFGRYLYSFLPRTLSGDRMSARQIEAEIQQLSAALPRQAPGGREERAPAVEVTLLQVMREDLRARRALRELGEQADVPPPMYLQTRRLLYLRLRIATLTRAEPYFRGWIVLHRPLTFLLFGLTVLHILAHYLFRTGQ